MSVLSSVAAAVKNSIPALRDAAHSLEIARERLAEIDAQIVAVDRLPPSRDELVDLYTRHLDEDGFVADFKRWHLNEQTLAQMTGTTFAAHPGAHVLAVGTMSPNQPSLIPAPADGTAQTTIRALEFVLAPLLRQRIGDLVDKALPSGYSGISSAERVAKVAKLQKEHAKLADEVDEIESALSQMGVVVSNPTKTGSDVEQQTARERAESFVAGRIDTLNRISPNKAVEQVEAAIANGGDIEAALIAKGA
jgi:hypothetical protein